MHPLEHLRYVARIEGADPGELAREAAVSLAEIAAGDDGGLVPACRRLVERHPANGPLWWLSARLLASPDPLDAARDSSAALAHDPTPARLAALIPDDTTVVVVGWPDLVAEALRRRGDVEVLVVDSGGDGAGLARWLQRAGSVVTLVPDRGIGSAVAVAGAVLVEATLAGPGGILATPGSRAAAAVGAQVGVAVWAVVGVGRVLPGPLWDAALAHLDAGGLEPWERDCELVPAELIPEVVTPAGRGGPEALEEPTCPAAPELTRPPAGGPGGS